MYHLRRLGNTMSIPIPADEDSYTGRECPEPACKGYFKVQFGTGIKGQDLPCHCPYCGHTTGHDKFWTEGQIEYAKSVALSRIVGAINRDLRSMEFQQKSKGALGIGMSLKFTPGSPIRIHQYREQQLETEAVCSNCTLRYAVYGVFAFCPDCGQHNSLQILENNLEVIDKMLDLSASVEPGVAEKLVENALEDCVSSLDGFGRELCRTHKDNAVAEGKVEKMTFQNLEGARTALDTMFSIDLSADLSGDDWRLATRCFQKRHLIAHKAGVIDQEYIEKTGDENAIKGRKVTLSPEEVRELLSITKRLARSLFSSILRRNNNS